MTAAPPLRVLVVEDEGVVRIDIECMLVDLGHAVAGSASSLEEAMAMAGDLEFDVAVLDLNLAGRSSVPVADVLAERGIPFVIASGYTSLSIPARHRDRPAVNKPFDMRDLASALGAVLPTTGVSPPAP